MKKRPGCRVNGNLNLSRAIGDLKYKSNEHLPAAAQIISAEPDVTQTTLAANDYFLVLACDGVWDVMSNQVDTLMVMASFWGEVAAYLHSRLHTSQATWGGRISDATLFQ